MKLKVCGMREADNLKDLLSLTPDYVGFIFYEKSPRYVGDTFRLPDLNFGNTQKVGVFVNHSIDFIFSQVNRYALQLIQLHGDESAAFCEAIKSPILRGARDISPELKTIKAFGVESDFDYQTLEAYLPHCDYFLFDTKTKDYGGSGQAFAWELLADYPFDLPFLLSGGLSLNLLPELLNFLKNHPHLPLAALDLNSRFEIAPAQKNTVDLATFFQEIRANFKPK